MQGILEFEYRVVSLSLKDAASVDSSLSFGSELMWKTLILECILQRVETLLGLWPLTPSPSLRLDAALPGSC